MNDITLAKPKLWCVCVCVEMCHWVCVCVYLCVLCLYICVVFVFSICHSVLCVQDMELSTWEGMLENPPAQLTAVSAAVTLVSLSPGSCPQGVRETVQFVT